MSGGMSHLNTLSFAGVKYTHVTVEGFPGNRNY